MDIEDTKSHEVSGPVRFDAAACLRQLVRPISFYGIIVLAFIVLGWQILGSNLSEHWRVLLTMFVIYGILHCFNEVNSKIKNAKDLVLDADYHKKLQFYKSLQGTALSDTINDFVDEKYNREQDKDWTASAERTGNLSSDSGKTNNERKI